MPAYSQPMMSAGQMPHTEVVSDNSAPVDTCTEEYVAAVDVDYTGSEDYYTATTTERFDEALEPAVEVGVNDEELAETLVSGR